MAVKVEPAQIRAEPRAELTQVRVYPIPSLGTAQFDMTSMMNLMMTMLQMVLMIVFIMLPIQLLPKIIGAIKV
jgi:hypothetical protein